ncbi:MULTISPECIES: VCBS domain-containing protein [Thalassospira]|uniref:VCBS domain-containing protein n=1 Tax=Thalassospira TaxID=168934 RepID=UPI001ADA5754|nr:MULTISPECIES: VCBS domain-containing protein [Thalassospira]MBO9508204.1 VCBS domain-containing protein [Thalassospira sp. A3_1]MCK2166178.1 VCBS domain-containing protein [Thalassospira xiamenensis]
MSKKVHSIIKFDGPALADHTMDVAHLAPALIALSDVIKAANQQFNGDRSAVKLLVNADTEQHCFELSLQLAQTIWEQVGALIQDDNVATAKEIAEWVGIVGGGTTAGSVSLFSLIRFLKGRTVKDTTIIKSKDGNHQVQIRVEGDDNAVVVSQPVYHLYATKPVRDKAIAVLQPLRSEGYESLEFHDDGMIFERFTTEDVPDPSADEMPDIRPTNQQISKIRTEVRIRKAAYEGKSKWTLMYMRAIEAPIDDLEWLEKFQKNMISAPPNSSLDVDLEQTVIVNENGEALEEPTYRVLKVYNVILPMKQAGLFDEKS